ncbi:MAG: oligosaccharide flippase family protein [Emcibacteraceae bacterium]|nr:oligosaccharide flippase family protein [Emcibacteraceae bacterium]
MNKNTLRVNSLANVAGQFYAIFIGIVIFPSYLNYLGPESFGLIGFFTMISTWLMMLDVGLSQTISRESARLRSSRKDLIEFKLVLRSVESIFFVIALVTAVLIGFYSKKIAENWLQLESLSYIDVSYCVALMGLMFACKWLVGLYKGALNGFEQQLWVNGFWITINSFKFIGGFFLIKYYSTDIVIYFTYQFFIFLCELFIVNRKVYKQLPIDKVFKKPSILTIKKIAPFALAIAFTSGLWILVSQVDKLLLSNILPLKEYGFFSLVVILSGGLMMLSAPIGTAIRPRLILLISQGKDDQMLSLYRKATQFVAVIGFSITGVVSIYSSDLIYMWTGNQEAANWGGPILSWYTLGNGILLILAFQYYIQFAYGNLKYHVIGNLYFGGFQVICMASAAYNYGAIGTGITWFALQLFFVSFWPGFIHSKFAPGLHLNWITTDVIKPLMYTILGFVVISLIDFNTESYERLELFFFLGFIWLIVLTINIFVSQETRKFTQGVICAFRK